MSLIEICPNCGHDLLNVISCTMSPIHREGCPNCGWNWDGELDKVERVQFIKFPESSSDWGNHHFSKDQDIKH